jgi:riboflavin kinase/FMN adenylyltransferase
MSDKSVIAVGNFDGFHLGHRQIVDEMFRIRDREGLKPILITFSPNPKVFFKKESDLIFTDKQKRDFGENIGLSDMVFLEFNKISNVDGRKFIENYLVTEYNMSHIVVGFNFRYGKNRECDINSLKKLSMELGFEITVITPIILKGEKISSTIIRKNIREGNIMVVSELLGHYYYIDGSVSKGNGRGRSIGYPTINIKTNNGLLPRGVFQTQVRLDEKIYDSITNIGYNPTFNVDRKNELKVETHIIGFDGYIYDKTVRIFFLRKIRDEKKFHSKKELIHQIKNDIKNMKLLIS